MPDKPIITVGDHRMRPGHTGLWGCVLCGVTCERFIELTGLRCSYWTLLRYRAQPEPAPKRGLWARLRRALGAGYLPDQEVDQ